MKLRIQVRVRVDPCREQPSVRPGHQDLLEVTHGWFPKRWPQHVVRGSVCWAAGPFCVYAAVSP
jgi:hypothetical protein